MGFQLDIDFVHLAENNRESQMHLEANLDKFNRQCKQVLGLLRSGLRLTTGEALLKYKIGDLRTRISDLRKAGINVKDEFIKDGEGKKTRFKEYFIEKTDS